MTLRTRLPVLLIAMMLASSTCCAKAAAFDGLAARITQATDDAAAHGATISVAVLDRVTDQLLAGGNDQLVAIASVAKLFIADDLLSRESDTPMSATESSAPTGAT